MDFARLRNIVAVARKKSFSRAAEDLHITQPALSRSIASFEAQYGVRLFDRGRGGVTVTPPGKQVVEQAQAILSSAGDLERNLRSYSMGEAGKVDLGLGPLMASVLLPRLGKSLFRSRPGLQIHASIGLSHQLLAELLEDSIELIVGSALYFGEVPGVDSESLSRIRMAVMVRAGHPLASMEKVTLEDLGRYPIASATDRTPVGVTAEGGSLDCDNFHILREVVLETDCAWFSSPAFVGREIAEGLIVPIKVTGLNLGPHEICILSRRGRTRSPAAAIVVEELRSIAADAEMA
ncbi:MAG: LysR family transcriptional regulator [Novosphingobium sp.]|nr:LysR family transcriptional regulator [Novosphingobium sp.]MCP5403713.1 LysR family transcriptional regulator [Novosphingobium sp.]